MSRILHSDDFLELIEQDADIIVPIANGEPIHLLDILEENHTKLTNVKIHQMLALRERDYILGEMKEHLSHVSYFLSGATRRAYHDRTIELVPNVFHEAPRMLKEIKKMSMIMTVASPIAQLMARRNSRIKGKSLQPLLMGHNVYTVLFMKTFPLNFYQSAS